MIDALFYWIAKLREMGRPNDALCNARQLWEQTHPNDRQGLATAPQSEAAGPERMTTEKQITANQKVAKKKCGSTKLNDA